MVDRPEDDHERILLLECRLEQMRAAVEAARADADRARARLAEAAAREAEHARRASVLETELAEARADLLALHRRLDRTDALKAEVEGHLLEAGARADAGETTRLRQALLVARQKEQVHARAVADLRARVEQLLSSRETLLSRIAEWQRLVREDGPEAADLAEFIAELRREVLDLEHARSMGEVRETTLRDRLAEAGLGPDASTSGVGRPALGAASRPSSPEGRRPARDEMAARLAEETVSGDDDGRIRAARRLLDLQGAAAAAPLAAALAAARTPRLRAALLVLLGRTGEDGALDAVRGWTDTADPIVRSAAYEALGRLLDGHPDGLAPHLRAGLCDDDPRVRRRVVLVAATARGLALRALLEPLRDDRDAGVRRLVREVLRRTHPDHPDASGETDAVLAAAVAPARALP